MIDVQYYLPNLSELGGVIAKDRAKRKAQKTSIRTLKSRDGDS
jgi:hypothetical protein